MLQSAAPFLLGPCPPPSGSDTVLIQSSDSKFCENCVYFILVTSDGNASYTISASRQNGGGQWCSFFISPSKRAVSTISCNAV